MYDSSKEILDLVDQDDKVIGQIERGEAYRQHLTNFRVIDAFLKDDTGRLFIPRRHASKKLFPLHLDTSVGGHVESGATYEETLRKEAMEELMLDVDAFTCRQLGVLTPHEHGTFAFISVYEISCSETPAYNLEDFCEAYWLFPSEIIERIENGDVAKGHLPIILKQFYR